MINETQAKSILRKHKKIDSWFLTHYGLNLYRGCIHNCAYCDGRSETYRVEGDFGKDIEVKTNAIEILTKELDPARKRSPMPKSYMMLGGGVSDSYQPVEKKYELARKTLELIHKFNYPVHILTKSTFVERDMDLIKKINQQSRAIVSYSFSSASDNISKALEPGVSSPSERLASIRKFKQNGIACGMFLMPIIPMITDNPKMIEDTLRKGKEAGIDFVIFGTMTLKEGRQKDYFMNVVDKFFPDFSTSFDILYEHNDKWGGVNPDYYTSASQIFDTIATKLRIPKRIPPYLYRNFLNKNDLVVVMLEHLDYLMKLKNRQNPYGYAAYKISQIDQEIKNLSIKEISGINGIGPVTAKIIEEIIYSGTSKYLENML
ncbi:MAG: radical SAM protein [Bacteroidales bacterium]|nr:radical SAM protein [Bacteroidales bacterium]